MTIKVSADVDFMFHQKQNFRYGSYHIGATAQNISDVDTDAAYGLVDIFHDFHKAVAATCNNFSKYGKADGIGYKLSQQ